MKSLFKTSVVCLLRRKNRQILFPLDTRKIPQGVCVVPRGKIRKRESILRSVYRNTQKTFGVKVTMSSTGNFAVVDYYRKHKLSRRVFFFMATEWVGKVKHAKRFKRLQWLSVGSLPYVKMHKREAGWLQWILANPQEKLLHVKVFCNDGGRNSLEWGPM